MLQPLPPGKWPRRGETPPANSQTQLCSPIPPAGKRPNGGTARSTNSKTQLVARTPAVSGQRGAARPINSENIFGSPTPLYRSTEPQGAKPTLNSKQPACSRGRSYATPKGPTHDMCNFPLWSPSVILFEPTRYGCGARCAHTCVARRHTNTAPHGANSA